MRTSSNQRSMRLAKRSIGAAFILGISANVLACTGDHLFPEGKSDAGAGGVGGILTSVGGTSANGITTSGGAFGAQMAASRCGAGRYWDGPTATCRLWTNCKPGEFVSYQGTSLRDRGCRPCDADTFSSAANAESCGACRACGSLTIEGSCTPTRDTQCAHMASVLQFGTTDVDSALAVAVDGVGDIWVAGSMGEITSETESQSRRGFARKYSAQGVLLVADEQSTPLDDQAYAIAVDGSGNAWVAGYTAGDLDAPVSGDYDAFLRAYAANGAVKFTDQFGSSRADEAAGLAVDARGNVWVVGDTNGNLGGASRGSYDPFVRSYSADGSDPITRHFGDSIPDAANAVAVDGAGNAWLVGSKGGEDEIFVRSFPVDGSPEFNDSFGTDAAESGLAIAVDAAGNVWVAGRTEGDLAGKNQGSSDAFVRKYPADGSAPVTDQFGTKGSDEARSVAIDSRGNVWVVGDTQCNISGTTLDLPMPITEDWLGHPQNAEEVCGTGQSSLGDGDAFVRVYFADGSAPRTYQFGTSKYDDASGVAAAPDGSVWIAGLTGGTLGEQSIGESDAFLARFTAEP